MNRRETIRAAMAGAAAAVAAPAVAQAAGNDAELIALCDRFTELERQKRHIFDTAPNTLEGDRLAQAETAPLYEEQDQIITRAHEMDAKTWDGVRARLRMAFSYRPTCIEGPSDWDDCIAGAILHDTARLLGLPTDTAAEAAL